MALGAFLSRKDGFNFLLTGFGKSFTQKLPSITLGSIGLLFYECDSIGFFNDYLRRLWKMSHLSSKVKPDLFAFKKKILKSTKNFDTGF